LIAPDYRDFESGKKESRKWEKGFLRMLKLALPRYDSVAAATFMFYLGNPFPRFLLS
jgi:hypothetical protein